VISYIFSLVIKLIYKYYYFPRLIDIYKKYFAINNDNKFKIIDIGANKGEFLNLVLKNFFFLINLNCIYAFEPNNQSFSYLKKNFSNKKIKLFNFAVGEKKFKTKINIGKFDSGHTTLSNINDRSLYFKIKKKILKSDIYKKKKQSVTVVKLDNYKKLFFSKKMKKLNSNHPGLENRGGDNIVIIKIDVEGYELNVLKGMKQILKNNFVKFIQIEIHLNNMYKNYSKNKIYTFLKINNFRMIKFLKFPFMKWGDAFFIRN
jgi:FkbM family methyltransferase